jgi:hypothetical protein
MRENAKCFIARTLVYQIWQLKLLGYVSNYDMKLVLWADDSRVAREVTSDEVPVELLDCKGSARAEPLIELIGLSERDRYIFLTDGSWPETTRRTLRAWRSQLPSSSVRAIRIGADANPEFVGADVFEAEELFGAIDDWWGNDIVLQVV